MNIYDIDVKTIDGEFVTLGTYRDKVLLIVNVASKWGSTDQYAGLEALYQKYKDRGLVVLGFPCNQFKAQEPDSEAEIKQFCTLNYGVTFPMFAKIDVNGEQAHPLYVHLKKERPGLLGSGSIKWNFTKFLVARDGQVRQRYPTPTTPESIEKDIVDLL